MSKVFDQFKIIDFTGLKISVASPEEIHNWSFGEVTKPETINYRTLKPEKDGLFCERIFGPIKDWECYCGKYKRIRYKGIICDKCGVEVTQSKVRRERMGHIDLACPIAHIWYTRNNPSKVALLLDVSSKQLENVIYFAQYLVLEVDLKKKEEALENLEKRAEKEFVELEKAKDAEVAVLEEEENDKIKDLAEKISNKEKLDLSVSEVKLQTKQKINSIKEKFATSQEHRKEVYARLRDLVKSITRLSIVSDEEYLKLQEYEAVDFFKVGMGAEAVRGVLEKMDLDVETVKIREEMKKATGQKFLKLTKRLRLIEGMKKSGLRPEWMILVVLPVIPPDLRPMVQLSGGRFASSDLNDLYRRVLNRNNRLKQLINLGAPEIILRNEKRMLQEAVDSLIDESQKLKNKPNAAGKKILKSLSEMLRGKQGRFRQNLLGKRVDYSGRSVIIVGPKLSLNECGLPKDMALEMFKPFVLRDLISKGYAPNVKSAKHLLDRKTDEVWDILEEITRRHPVLLNRAPTLHKLGFQAFYPILIEGKAIQIHPCVCAGYNADFDGDQMAVHVPLSQESVKEAESQMMAKNNLLKPADGSPISVPNKEMVIGCFYLTSIEKEFDHDEKSEFQFSSFEEAIYAYQTKKVNLRQQITLNYNDSLIKTTVGRILFNEILPESLRFLNEEVKSATIKNLISKGFEILSNDEIVQLIDDIKKLGFWAATLAGGLSVSVFDCEIVKDKNQLIKAAEDQVKEIEENYLNGLITKEEERRFSNEIWIQTTEKIADLTWEILEEENPVKLIIRSGGARASKDQLKQLSAMRGLVVDPLGKIVPLPTKSNFREGLSIFEYVTSSRGSRKGLTDSALKTADAGYLTRRLVDVAHDVIIREEDCHSQEGIAISKTDLRQASFYSRLVGRIIVSDLVDKKTKEVIIPAGGLIEEKHLEKIKETGIETIIVRSPLTCQAKYGLCAKCYGRDFSTKKEVEIGVPVGVIAAQSIGEPGTQLTMRVRHAGGIVGLDVTQGLPRAEELFETRIPKNLALISEISGKVTVEELPENYRINVKSLASVKPVEEREYILPKNVVLKVHDKDLVGAGDPLTEGYLNIHEVLTAKGLREAQGYLIDELQAVYESQGIPINDKHFEVIVRKMSDKVKVITSGDTVLLPGEYIEKSQFNEENAKVLSAGGEPATAKVVILGITKSSLYTSSWLSASSFEQTTSVLADAAVVGKEDKLLGLKENVIIGRLIPVNKDRAMIQ